MDQPRLPEEEMEETPEETPEDWPFYDEKPLLEEKQKPMLDDEEPLSR